MSIPAGEPRLAVPHICFDKREWRKIVFSEIGSQRTPQGLKERPAHSSIALPGFFVRLLLSRRGGCDFLLGTIRGPIQREKGMHF